MASSRRPFLTSREFLFLGLTILFWAGFVVVLGKDTSWDFRNYHWYGPYAFLNNRLDVDVAVAHQASYYNPTLDLPFYWLATQTHSWLALAVLGAVQGATIVPLYLICREGIRLTGPGESPPERSMADQRLAAGALALLAQFGALTLTEFGTTYYDNVMSVLVFSGLAILLVRRDELRGGPALSAAWIAGLAGFITGMAMGLKLPEMPFCFGFAAALVALGGGFRQQTARLIGGGIGGVLGFSLFSGWWMLKMWKLTGNPVFPYFNEYWHSPLALAATYQDLRFVPTHFWRELFFPVLFSVDWHVADDLGFQDFRVCIAYFAVIGAVLLLVARRQNSDPLIENRIALPLFAFSAASYLVWLKVFAIYRYIVALEMLSPLLIVAAVGLVPGRRRSRYLILAGLAFAILVTQRSDFLERAPIDDPYVQAAIPPIPEPDNSMVVMTGDAPMGFIATQLPPQIPVLRIDGWMVQPRDGTQITRQMKDRVSRHLKRGGALYLIADVTETARARDALSDYGLAIRWTECQQFDTNLVGTYQWCPLARK